MTAQGSKEEILRQMQVKLDEYKQKIEEFKAAFNRQVEELQAKQEAAEEKLSEFKSSSSDAWREMKEGLDQAVDDLAQACKDASSQFK